jgi:signal transduction histidine kinase/ActR/RegA family two-component response regulator
MTGQKGRWPANNPDARLGSIGRPPHSDPYLMEVTPTFLDNLDRLGAWGILTTDCNLRIVSWNRWLERHSGKAAGEVIGQPLFAVYPDLTVRALDRYYQQAIEGQSSMLSQRFHKYVLPMPPTVPTSTLMHMQQTVRISPLTVEGAIRGTLTLIEDVTERIVTEYDLREQADRLEEANRHKDEFLALLGHELRNPLAPIRSGIELLKTIGSQEPEARDTREMMERQVTHMVRLVDDLLDVSRIIRGKVRLQPEPCELVSMLRQIASDHQSLLADNGVRLTVDLPAEDCWLMGDRTRLSQVVSNLLHNASKFTNRGGEVRLIARPDPASRTFEITVQDNGIGMTEKTLRKVFDAFSQAESTLDRAQGGLGLGLALVKGLTELHGGTVKAQSAGLGHGSSFTVSLPITSLPLTTTEARPQVAPSATESAPAFKGKHVLVIEDNRDAANILQKLIARMGFRVDVAHSGFAGLEAARRAPPDIVICDIGLPGLDGFAVARALRAEEATSDAFLIAQSGYGQAGDIQRALEAGFDLHLIKPMDISKLEDTLRGASRSAPRPIVM